MKILITLKYYFVVNIFLCFHLSLKMSHSGTSALCRSIKLQCELYPSREVAVCLDPYCGLGFVLWCLCRCGPPEHSILSHQKPFSLLLT